MRRLKTSIPCIQYQCLLTQEQRQTIRRLGGVKWLRDRLDEEAVRLDEDLRQRQEEAARRWAGKCEEEFNFKK